MSLIKTKSGDAHIHRREIVTPFLATNSEIRPRNPKRSTEKSAKRQKVSIRRRTLQRFMSGFATLLHAGMDLRKALATLERESREPLKSILGQVGARTRSGESLSSAMTKTGAFSAFHVRVVRAGEHSGDLEGALRRLAEVLEREEEIHAKIRNAVAYPLFLIAFGIFSFSIILFFVLPKFLGIYEEMGTKLPFLTKTLLQISGVIRESALWLVPVTVVLLAVMAKKLAHLRESIVFDRIRMGLPVLGNLFREIETANLLRILGLLLQSGLPAAQALKTSAEVLDSAIFRRATLSIESGVQKGGRISAEMAKQNLFSERVVNLVAVGEESGRLQTLLSETSQEMEKDVDQIVKTALIFLEPLLILCVGLLIGLMVMAALLPIFSLSSGLQR